MKILRPLFQLIGPTGIVLIFAQLSQSVIFGQNQPKYEYKSWRTSGFRYIIFRNTANPDSPKELIQRRISILLEESAFNIENLKELFALVCKRYPKPDWLEIYVFTNLIQIPTPEEQDKPPLMESKFIDPYEGEYPSASMTRIQENEIIRYTADRPYINKKSLVLKGADPPKIKHSPN